MCFSIFLIFPTFRVLLPALLFVGEGRAWSRKRGKKRKIGKNAYFSKEKIGKNGSVEQHKEEKKEKMSLWLMICTERERDTRTRTTTTTTTTTATTNLKNVKKHSGAEDKAPKKLLKGTSRIRGSDPASSPGRKPRKSARKSKNPTENPEKPRET